MPRLARLILVTFLESFATILIERGVYFYAHDRLAFTDTENLWLALGFGVAYATGALASHALARRWSEKGLLVATLAAQLAGHLVLCLWHGPVLVAVLNTVMGGIFGLKWPVIESYVGAGRTPKDQAATIGRFNLSWAGAVPPALAVAGPLIDWRPEGLFAAAGLLTAVSLVLVWPLDRHPVHLSPDHPERPAPGQMARIRGLLGSSRWAMLMSYSLMWILAALLPHVLANFDVGVKVAPALSGLLDVVRAGTFLTLQFYTGWHHRRWPLVWVIPCLPAGFFLALFGPNLPTVLVGELVFGVSAGMVYYAALYYAMVFKNASVDAGGAHEGLIGSGFAIGPAAGLVGYVLAPALGGPVQGMLVGTGVVILTCAAGAVRSLVKMGRAAPPHGPG